MNFNLSLPPPPPLPELLIKVWGLPWGPQPHFLALQGLQSSIHLCTSTHAQPLWDASHPASGQPMACTQSTELNFTGGASCASKEGISL